MIDSEDVDPCFICKRKVLFHHRGIMGSKYTEVSWRTKPFGCCVRFMTEKTFTLLMPNGNGSLVLTQSKYLTLFHPYRCDIGTTLRYFSDQLMVVAR